MKFVVIDKVNFTDAQVQSLKQKFDIEIYTDVPRDEAVIIDRIKSAQVITANFIDITENIINNSPNLKYIIVPAVGYDWIDITTCNKLGIKVINCPTHNSLAVAEHAFAHILAVSRRIVEAHKTILSGQWRPNDIEGQEITGKNLFVLGTGNAGSKIIEMGKTLQMQVSSANSKTSDDEIDEFLKQADYFVIAAELNEKTKGMIDTRRLSLLKSTAILVNVARGLIVDQDALYETLVNNRIAGAGLDVFPDDLTIDKTPEHIMKFAKLKNVTATPHIGFSTKESSQRLILELISNFNAIAAGKPINVVN